MAKKSKIAGDELSLVAKAIRRGEKLERTLTKLVVLQETGSPAEAFLNAVRKGLESLQKEESAPEEGGKAQKKSKAVKQKASGERMASTGSKRTQLSSKQSAPTPAKQEDKSAAE